MTEVIKELRPLSEEGAFLKFLNNIGDGKKLDGWAQKLENAMKDYQLQVCATDAASQAV